nr:hypothetical protein [Tanacetum cinerariifolium]
DGEQDSGTINRTQSMAIPNEPIPQGTSLGGSPRNYSSKEESPKVRKEEKVKKSITQEEFFQSQDRHAKIQGRYGHDTKINTASTSITTASINITTVEPVTTVNAPITTAGVSVSTAEPTKERGSKEKSSETATRPARGVIMRESSETTTRPTVPPQQKLDPKDKGKGKMVEPKNPLKKKDQIEFDEEVTRNLKA